MRWLEKLEAFNNRPRTTKFGTPMNMPRQNAIVRGFAVGVLLAIDMGLFYNYHYAIWLPFIMAIIWPFIPYKYSFKAGLVIVLINLVLFLILAGLIFYTRNVVW